MGTLRLARRLSSRPRRRLLSTDTGRDSPGSTRARTFAQRKGVPPVRESWASTSAAVSSLVRAASGTGPSAVMTRSSGSCTATWAGSPLRIMA